MTSTERRDREIEARNVGGLIANQFIAISTDNAVIFLRETTVDQTTAQAAYCQFVPAAAAAAAAVDAVEQ